MKYFLVKNLWFMYFYLIKIISLILIIKYFSFMIKIYYKFIYTIRNLFFILWINIKI